MVDLNDNTKWSPTDASNNADSPNGYKSGSMLPSHVEPVGRAGMGALKRWHDQVSPTLTSGGSANVQTLTPTVAHAAYVAGDLFGFIAGFTNTAATTLNVSGLGAKNIKQGTTALLGGEIVAGLAYLVAYDGTSFQLLNASLAGAAWTPTLAFGGGTTGITYSTRSGIYFRLGQLVTVEFDFLLTSKGSSTGAATITGLPFTNNASCVAACNIAFWGNTNGITGFDGSYINTSATAITLNGPGATGPGAYTDTAFNNNTRIAGSATYSW